MMNYLKIGRASDLSGKDYNLYRILEILPGLLSWGTLLLLVAGSYFRPVWVSFFIIAFDVYWLLLVLYLIIHLLASYRLLERNKSIDWALRCQSLDKDSSPSGLGWDEIVHLVILPFYREPASVIRPTVEAIRQDSFPGDRIILVLAAEERAGPAARELAANLAGEYRHHFRDLLVSVHPDGIPGEIKGKGANQSWAIREAMAKTIAPSGLAAERVLVSVFDIDTVINRGYFFCLTYNFLTAPKPYRASYQPIPVYHNNIWRAPFFSRVAAASNTFWQMMQQIRREKLATYSSHSMTLKALLDIDFWSTSMVSEDSRIFWHCFCHYRGDYEVRPLYFPVSMDATEDITAWQTAKNLYRQQRRWGWGVENIPYLMFNTIRLWRELPKGKFISRILVQLHGFHSWATNALIIAVVGWLPLLLGGDNFNATVLSRNLPFITRNLMTLAMIGLFVSAVLSLLLLPPAPAGTPRLKKFGMFWQWLFLPLTIVFFGAVPGLEAQTRLMFKKYLGFWVTPKRRDQA